MNKGKCAILTTLLLLNVWGGYGQFSDDQDGYIPKGEYDHTSTATKQVTYGETLYESNAEVMDEAWQAEGFHLEEGAFATGAYGPNQSFRAVSPTFLLPVQRVGTHIYLKLDSKIHSESWHDVAYIRVVNTFTGESSTIYANYGEQERTVEYINLGYYAGTSIQLEFSFSSDSTYHGDGWSIYGVSIVGDNLQQTLMRRETKSLRNINTLTRGGEGDGETPSSSNDLVTLDYEGINIQVLGVTYKDGESGTVSFTMTKSDGEYFTPEEIDSSHFTLRINGNIVPFCGQVHKSEHNNVDIVVALDCSSSMNGPNTNLINTIPLLTEGIGKFDAKLAPVRFGATARNAVFDTLRKDTFECDPSIIPAKIKDLECKDNFEYGSFVPADRFKIVTSDKLGDWEMYYNTLLRIANKQTNNSSESQKVIIMIGNETHDHEHYHCPFSYYCWNGEGKDTTIYLIKNDQNTQAQKISTDSVINTLRSKGFQTIIISGADNEFNLICQSTHGKQIDINNGNFNQDDVINTISSSLSSRYFIDFCSESSYKCDTIVDVSLQIKSTGAVDETPSLVEYMPLITRDSATMAYDEHGYHCNGDIRIAFDVSNYCVNDFVNIAKVLYSVDDGLHFNTVEAVKVGSLYEAYIPKNSIPTGIRKIDYRISVQMSKGRFIAVSPLVTNTMGDTWTIPVCCDSDSVGCVAMPKVTDVSWNCDSTILVKVANVDPADSINVFFMYNNGYKEGTLAAQYTYVPVKMTDFTEQEGEWIYSMKIPDDVVNQHLAYFVYIVGKNGLKSWYGNGNETMHDAEFTLDCEPDFCGSLQLSLNPIRSDSCVLSFTLLKERMVNFKIFHTDGTPLEYGNKTLSVDKGCVAGENKYNMNDLFSNIFNMGINPREPLVISVSTGNHVAMAYFYVSRVKGKK